MTRSENGLDLDAAKDRSQTAFAFVTRSRRHEDNLRELGESDGPPRGRIKSPSFTSCLFGNRVQKNEEVVLSVVGQQDRSTNDTRAGEPHLSI
jgi:hypothetical protein